ncbi:MAG: 3-phosphoshikimate 1-carboxyvinyltransferase [Thermoplasmata archaeon]
MKIDIVPAQGKATINLPSSKSHTQRYAIIGSVTEENVIMHGVSMADDESIAVGMAKKSRHISISGESIHIFGDFRCPGDLYAGESATAYRLSIGAFSARHCSIKYHGDPSLSSRPMNGLVSALSDAGVRFERDAKGFFSIDGKKAENVNINVSGESSQFVSSLMIYYAVMGGGSFRAYNVRSGGYLGITAECLRSFGFETSFGEDISIARVKKTDVDVTIERDFSSAAFFIVLGLISERWDISISGLNYDSQQPDRSIISMLEGNLKLNRDSMDVKPHIEQTIVVDADVNPDLCPPIAVAGIFSERGIVIKNPERLRYKESNREDSIVKLAEMFGAVVERGDRQILIRRGNPRVPEYTDFSDHRMIMAAVIAGLASGKKVTHMNIEKVAKSFPSFLREIRKLSDVMVY